jgi:TNF receptor-associated factor 4
LDCEYCKKELRSEQLDEHFRACPQFPLECPNGCSKARYARDELRGHLNTCPKAGSSCPFAEFGCKHKGERTALQKHIREEPTKHLSLLCDGVVELKRLLLNMQLNVERVGRRIEELTMKTDNLEKLYGAQLLWKIDNYTQKYNEAKAGSKTTVFSPPFLTGRHGYKMALSACLFGDGKVRGKNMSLFIGILRGEYDALLTWPFSHRVTFTLLDQCQDPAARKNITYTVKPNAVKENRAFLGRPTSERNASFGAQKFCEINMLDKLDYIRDDVMFIKVQVDTEDMVSL